MHALKKTHHVQGFTLVELLISVALGSILLLALASYLSYLMKSYQMQEDSNMLYHQALFISNMWQKELANAADLGCQIFDHPNQITHAATDELLTNSGIAIYQVGQDFLPKILLRTIQKKLLPHSIVVVTEGIQTPAVTAIYTPQNKQFSLNHPAFQKGDVVLLSSCHEAWRLQWDHTGAKNFTIPFSIKEPTAHYQIALWHTTLWFAMQDNQNHYGIYRLMLPNESTPVEIISNVSAFKANVWLNHDIVPATLDINWQQVHKIELLLTLEKNHLSIYWPTSIALLRKAQALQKI